jgi:hypothetical protein
MVGENHQKPKKTQVFFVFAFQNQKNKKHKENQKNIF